MTEHIEFTVQGAGERLDKLIVAQLGDRLTRTQIQTLIREGGVRVNGAVIKPGVKLKGGEVISVNIPPPPEDTSVEPEPIPLTVLYEDDDLAVIDKPAGLVVHPGAGNETGTLVNAILARYPEIAQMDYAPKRRGIVHRLDKDTSGVILIARRAPILQRLMRQFAARTVEKVYLALTEKPPKTNIGRIDAPIARDPQNRKRMKVVRDGKPAVSEFQVIERFKDGKTLLSVKLLTGRTHQIRVHLAFIDCPLVGDTVYGFRKPRFERQFLHAAKLCFDHPRTRERLCFESPLPDHLRAYLDNLRRA
jgi:23S rRNA pseudouridine1911/1915/1917 synthase